VTLIALDEGTQLSGLQRIVENDAPADGDEGTEGAAGAATEGN
jgi:DNA gyrase subunit A